MAETVFFRPLLSIVLPAHNEERALPTVTAAIAAALPAWPLEIVVVDDGSSDGTWAVVQELSRTAGVRGIRFTRNFGHQAALLAGLLVARGDAVIMMDADGQHPPELLATLVERWQEGSPVVQAVRQRQPEAGVVKRWTRSAFYRLLRWLAGVEIPAGSADFRLLSRAVLNDVLASAGPLLFLRALVPWLGYPIAQVPFQAAPRLGGRPAYGFRRMVRLSIDGLLGFSIVPLRLSIIAGFVIAGASLLYLVYVVVVRFTAGNVVPGWASMTGLLALIGGIQLITLGVLGEYLGRVFLSSLNRPHYVIRERSDPGPNWVAPSR